MKKRSFKATIALTFVLLLHSACYDILNEEPRSVYEPGFFSTEEGVEGGITSLYAHLRYIYGQAYYYNTTLTGTDEVTYGESADQNFLVVDVTGQGETTSTTRRAEAVCGAASSSISTASGSIEYAAAVGLSDELIAEARWSRVSDYFPLFRTFGGVPLERGAVEREFS